MRQSWERTTLQAFGGTVGGLGDKGLSDSPEVREEGFYWVVLGQNPPKIGNAASGGCAATINRGSRTR